MLLVLRPSEPFLLAKTVGCFMKAFSICASVNAGWPARPDMAEDVSRA